MKLVVAEKNIAEQKIAQLLADAGAPKNDKVYNTQVYRFKVGGEDWDSMGLAGHILAPDFPDEILFDKKMGWYSLTEDGEVLPAGVKVGGEDWDSMGLAGHILAPDFPDEILFDKKMGWYSLTEDGEVLPAGVPDGLARPPYDTKRKPFLTNGINIKGWKVESLPYLTWSPIIKNPAEKEILRVRKNLANMADEVLLATDGDREGEQGERRSLHAAGGAHVAKAAELGEREVAREDGAPNEIDVLAGLAGVGQVLVELDQVGKGLGDLALDEGGVAGAGARCQSRRTWRA